MPNNVIRILYIKPKYIRELVFSGLDDNLKKLNPDLCNSLKSHDLQKTHQLLAVRSPAPYLHPEALKGYDNPIQGILAQVYEEFQGENWSPNGEAKELISALGLDHTSMSVGDIINYNDDFYMVQLVGFKKL